MRLGRNIHMYIQTKTQTNMAQTEMTKILETKNGVALFFDGTNYSSNNMPAVKAALREDIANVAIDPFAAMLATSILMDLG